MINTFESISSHGLTSVTGGGVGNSFMTGALIGGVAGAGIGAVFGSAPGAVFGGIVGAAWGGVGAAANQVGKELKPAR